MHKWNKKINMFGLTWKHSLSKQIFFFSTMCTYRMADHYFKGKFLLFVWELWIISKWVWPGNATIKDRRPTHGTVRMRHSILTSYATASTKLYGKIFASLSQSHLNWMISRFQCILVKSDELCAFAYNCAQKHDGFVGFENACSRAKTYVILTPLNYNSFLCTLL